MKPLNRSQIKKLHRDNSELRNERRISFMPLGFESGFNVGHIFRLADAVDAEKLILTGRTPVPPDHDIEITSMRQDRRIPFLHFDKYEDAIKFMKDEGWELVSIEIASKSIYYKEYRYSQKVCFVLGNENDGVYPYALKHSTGIVSIPMFGKNYSLNVHVAASIVCYDAILRKDA